MFWGVSLESGKRYSQIVDASYHISMACLEPRDTSYANKQVCVMVEEKSNEYLLCTLEYGKVIQVNLDLKFKKGEDVTFFLNGEGSVHLTGYLLPEDDEYEDFEEDDDDAEESLSEPEVVGSSRLLESDDISDEDSEDYVPQNDKKAKSNVKNKLLDSASKEDEDDDDDDDDDYDLDEEDEDNDIDLEDEDDDEEEDDDDEEEESEEEIPTANGKRKVQLSKGNDTKRAKTDVATPAKGKPKGESPKKQKQVNKNLRMQKDEDSSDSDVLESSIGRTPMPTKKTESFQNIQPVKVIDLNSSAKKKKKQQQNKQNNETNVQKKNNALENFRYSKKLPGGVLAEDLKVGHGPIAKITNMVHISYVGRLPNNKVFDSNMDGKPFTFRLGRGDVIKGMEIGIEGMQVGGKRKLKIPPTVGYGKKGSGNVIPPNSTLYFTVELKAVT